MSGDSGKTAIIGLGSMGLGMAGNILSAGIPLSGFDISPDSLARFGDLGGTPAKSARDAALGASLLVVMVVSAEQASDALFGSGGAAAAMAEGGVVMLCSTVAPSEAREIGERARSSGLALLDAPVSGGKAGADAGTLTVMASGPAAAFERAGAVLEAISSKTHRLGDEPGMGSTYKVVHQLAAGVHLVAAAELMALGAKAGCDPDTLFEIVSTSAGQSWMLKDRVPSMLKGDYTPRSMVDIFVKDLGLVLQTGRDCKAPLPLSAAALQMMLAASSMGHGALDDSAVVKAYEAMTGTPVKRD